LARNEFVFALARFINLDCVLPWLLLDLVSSRWWVEPVLWLLLVLAMLMLILCVMDGTAPCEGDALEMTPLPSVEADEDASEDIEDVEECADWICA
jgi:hypothetical protein